MELECGPTQSNLLLLFIIVVVGVVVVVGLVAVLLLVIIFSYRNLTSMFGQNWINFSRDIVVVLGLLLFMLIQKPSFIYDLVQIRSVIAEILILDL